MKPKQIIILVIILAFLAAAVFATHLKKPAELVTEEYTPLDLSFNTDQIARINVSKPKGEKDEEFVRMEKQGGSWKISSLSNARADQDKVSQLLKTLREVKGELRSKDKALFNDFGIAESDAYALKLMDSAGKNLLAVRLGKKKSGDSVFVRKDGSDQVFLAAANIFNALGLYGDPASSSLNNDYWAATDLVSPDPAQVETFSVHRFDSGREVVSANVARARDAGWKFAAAGLPFKIDANKVKQYLESLKTWKAQKVESKPKKDYGFDPPSWRLSLVMKDGKEIQLTAGKPDTQSKTYPIKVTGEPVVFELSHYYFENMDVDDSHFFGDNPLEIDVDKTEKLVIHADKKKMSFKPKQKKWDALTSYLNEAKNFRVSRILFDPKDQKKVKAGGAHWIELQKTGEPALVIDVGELALPEEKEYAASRRSQPYVFTIQESVYKQLFDNLDRLAEPKATPTPAPTSTPVPSSAKKS